MNKILKGKKKREEKEKEKKGEKEKKPRSLTGFLEILVVQVKPGSNLAIFFEHQFCFNPEIIKAEGTKKNYERKRERRNKMENEKRDK